MENLRTPDPAPADTADLGDLGRRVGYLVKQAQSALRAQMDRALRPLELTVPQYSCLELLHQNPGLTNADLARASFVSAQSMNTVLAGLAARGLVRRPERAEGGRRLPAELTAQGRALVEQADRRVRRIEERMLAPLGAQEAEAVVADLARLVEALESGDDAEG